MGEFLHLSNMGSRRFVDQLNRMSDLLGRYKHVSKQIQQETIGTSYRMIDHMVVVVDKHWHLIRMFGRRILGYIRIGRCIVLGYIDHRSNRVVNHMGSCLG